MKSLGGSLPGSGSGSTPSVSLWGNALIVLAAIIWSSAGLFITQIMQGSDLTPWGNIGGVGCDPVVVERQGDPARPSV